MTVITLEYDSSNSGGRWWLSDEDWRKLAAAGWAVKWYQDQEGSLVRERFLGALASNAEKEFETPQEGIDEWAKITGQDPSAEGCNCCGQPHNFSYKDSDGAHHYASVVVTETILEWS